MQTRLQKILSQRGVASRRGAEEMILSGRVSVNGAAAQLGESADPDTDVILVDGNPLPAQTKAVYLMLHKPRGYVTTLSDEKGRRTAAELVADCGCRVYPVGRLDMDSEGLLLFTNDGEIANGLMHPKFTVEKEYTVFVRGYTPEKLELLKRPIALDGYTIAPPQVRLIQAQADRAQVSVIIHEGRNRQVRRMCEAAGMQVNRLKRIREGEITLGNLPAGAWRYLNEGEIGEIKKLCNKSCK